MGVRVNRQGAGMFEFVTKDGTLIGIILTLLALIGILISHMVKAWRETLRARKEFTDQLLLLYQQQTLEYKVHSDKLTEVVIKNNDVITETKHVLNAVTKSVDASLDIMQSVKDIVTEHLIKSTR